MQIHFKQRIAEPPVHVRGDIARTYFYMNETHGIRLSRQQRQLMSAWAAQDPVDEWELIRANRIESIQGNRNRFVQGD
jgi:deoxyribonuclease-1